MEFKLTGSTHGMNGKGGFISHVNYLGTTADGTPSHSNPKKDEYYQAKADYAKTGNHAYLLTMSRDTVYLQRDIRTFSNMKGRSKRDFIANERKLMKGTGRKVKSIDFVVSPSPSGDKLDPNNSHDVSLLEDYMTMLMHNTFNGYFMKANQVTKSGYHRYKFRRTKGDRFGYYGVIQCDSHDNSNMHGHLTLLNYDYTSGNGMNRSYYGRNHIKQSVKRTTAEWNRLHPEHQMTGVNRKLTGSRKPTRIIIPIIQGVRATLRNPRITSQKKLIKALAKHNVQAKRLRKTKHRKHAAWKFRWTGGKRKHSWISSTRLSSYRGAGSYTAKTIDNTLHQHLVNRMNARKSWKSTRSSIINDSGMDSSETSNHKESVKNSRSMSISADSVTSRNSLSSTYSIANSQYSSQISTISGDSPKAVARAQNETIQPEWESLTRRFGAMMAAKRHAEDIERKRVTHIMSAFYSDYARSDSWWSWNYAIPAHCVGYDDKIPEFAISKHDQRLLSSLIKPIIKAFRTGEQWIALKWKAGKKAINNYMNKYHINRFHLNFTTTANTTTFYKHWYKIKSIFIHRFIQHKRTDRSHEGSLFFKKQAKKYHYAVAKNKLSKSNSTHFNSNASNKTNNKATELMHDRTVKGIHDRQQKRIKDNSKYAKMHQSKGPDRS